MTRRLEPIVEGEIYHVFNKTLNRKRPFQDNKFSDRFLKIALYYRSSKATLSYSVFHKLKKDLRQFYEKELYFKKYHDVKIICYTFMPNHYHFLLTSRKNGAISRFISDITQSITKWYNLKTSHDGPLFKPVFKAVRITNESQLAEVSRYIHLNPFSDELLADPNLISSYPWSSFSEYTNTTEKRFCETNFLLQLFNNDQESYREFVLGNASYSKSIKQKRRNA